jgi:hypothetical protein
MAQTSSSSHAYDSSISISGISMVHQLSTSHSGTVDAWSPFVFLASVSAHQCQRYQAATLALADLALLLRPVPLLFPLLPLPLLLLLTTLTLLFVLPPLLPLLLLLLLPLLLTLTPALLLPLAALLVLTVLPLPLLVLALRLLLPLLPLPLTAPLLVLPLLPPVPVALLEVVAAFCVRGERFLGAGAAAALHCLHSGARPVRLLAAPKSVAGRTLPQPLHIWHCTLPVVRSVHICGGVAGNLRDLQLAIQRGTRHTVTQCQQRCIHSVDLLIYMQLGGTQSTPPRKRPPA